MSVSEKFSSVEVFVVRGIENSPLISDTDMLQFRNSYLML